MKNLRRCGEKSFLETSSEETGPEKIRNERISRYILDMISNAFDYASAEMTNFNVTQCLHSMLSGI